MSFSAPAKKTASSPQSQKDKPQRDGEEQDVTNQPNPKTAPTTTPSPPLDGRNLFPEEPLQQDSVTHNPPANNSSDPKNGTEESHRTNGMPQQEPPPDTQPKSDQNKGDVPVTGQAPRQHLQMENDSEDASMLTGISPDKSRASDFDMYEKEEAITPKIKKKVRPEMQRWPGRELRVALGERNRRDNTTQQPLHKYLQSSSCHSLRGQ